MVTQHQQDVGKLATELEAIDQRVMSNDPDVQIAQAALDAARRALTLDRHNPARQQAVRDAEHAYLAVTNTWNRNQTLAKIAARKAEQLRLANDQQAHVAGQAEAEAKADMLPAWLAAGGTTTNFNAAWPRLWEEELVSRSREQDRDLTQRLLLKTKNPGF